MRTVVLTFIVLSVAVAVSVYSPDYPNIFTRVLYGLGFTTLPKEKYTLRIGVLSTANINPTALCNPARLLPNIEIVAIAARSKEQATAFALKHDIPRVLDSYDDIINDPNIDAIYNPLPNSLHHEWTIKAVRAGKHVLCEKPFTSNAEEAQNVNRVLQEKNANGGANTPEQRFKGPIVVLEAFHWRVHPHALRVKEILRSGVLGRITHTSTSFHVSDLVLASTNIRFNHTLSGGAVMDLGAYAVSSSRWVSLNDEDEEPTVISATPTVSAGNEKIDNTMRAVLKYPNGVISNISCGYEGYKFSSTISIIGEKGTLETFNFVMPSLYHYITLTTEKEGKKNIVTETAYGNGHPTYAYQLEAFRKAVSGELTRDQWKDVGITSAEEAIKNMKIIDQIYEKSGLGKRGI
jgi:predicted dehydrogenase